METRGADGKTTRAEHPRIKAEFLDLNQAPPIINVVNGGYMIDAMFKLRPTRDEGMSGRRATDWPEILAFAQGSGRISEPWELELLADMCEAYLAGLTSGAKPLSRSPVQAAKRAAEQRTPASVRRMLGGA